MTPTPTVPARVTSVAINVRLPFLLLLVVGGSLVIAIAASRHAAGGGAGCSLVAAGQIVESQKFTPYSSRMTQTPDEPINPTGAGLNIPTAARSAPATIDDLPLRWVVTSANGGFEAIYFDRAIDATLTGSALAAGGSVWFDHQPRSDAQSFAAYLLSEHPDRTVAVDIGGNPGVLVWADPGPNGDRTHNVYWSDGKFEFGLSAIRPPEVAVNLARGIACAGS